MINSGRLEVKYVMDEIMRNKGISGYIEGNVSAMGDVAGIHTRPLRSST